MKCNSCGDNVRESQFPKRKYKGQLIANQPCNFCRHMQYMMQHGPTVSAVLESLSRRPTEITEATARYRL